jgi:hypothetical protein
MQQIKAEFISGNQNRSIEHTSEELNLQDKHKIDQLAWEQFSYKPEVDFVIAYDENHLLLKYFVKEKQIKAIYTAINDPVYKDTCVEFFISFGNEKEYYNFEFNCIGNCLGGYGTGKENRSPLPVHALQKIKTYSSIGQPSGHQIIAWELTIQIPFEVFTYHQLKSLKAEKCNTNFYKCGDDLIDPHFLSWNLIKSEDVNFHLPEFFGQLQFV